MEHWRKVYHRSADGLRAGHRLWPRPRRNALCADGCGHANRHTNGYIVARQMGGDAELYAITMNWQLAVSVIAFPLIIYLTLG